MYKRVRVRTVDKLDQYPKRRRLPHNVPSWVSEDARYFVTINCRVRNTDVLCRDGMAKTILRSVDIYRDQERWYPWLVMVMPDHIHLIVSIDRNIGLKRVISAWKGFHAKQFAIEWQSGFFEHRLRTLAEFDEKVSYIRNNPVRKGLATDARDWPYIWERR